MHRGSAIEWIGDRLNVEIRDAVLALRHNPMIYQLHFKPVGELEGLS